MKVGEDNRIISILGVYESVIRRFGDVIDIERNYHGVQGVTLWDFDGDGQLERNDDWNKK